MLPNIPRYLASFHPKHLHHLFTDVLIIGSGLAGMRAAIEVDPKLSVLVLTKDQPEQSNSTYAQGGIAGVIDPDDHFSDHSTDTLTAGGKLCDPGVVDMVVKEAPQRIQELIDWGTHFDEEEGKLTLGREGGHSHFRIVHALGDATGREVMRAVIAHVRTLKNVELWKNTFTIDLLTHEGACRGAIVWHPQYGLTLIWAKQTIICTGGAGQVFRETTNPLVATGDGHAIAYRAGAKLRDMEFIQFHPTVLYIAGSSRDLITEAVRGEGAHLIDCNGKRFMVDQHDQAELAPRDIVSQAIVRQMKETRHPSVYLDLSHLDSEYIKIRFPGINQICFKFGLDITKDRIPVRPGAHYFIGGIVVDQAGQTSLPGLWAAGEVTSSGLHGANRLASNSLLEGLVYGAHAGSGASQAAMKMPDRLEVLPLENQENEQSTETLLDLLDIRNSLKSLMGRNAGVQRDREGLISAAATIDSWSKYVLKRQFSDPSGWELQNMLIVSSILIQAALDREESRGVHLRNDFPQIDEQKWQRHLVYQQ